MRKVNSDQNDHHSKSEIKWIAVGRPVHVCNKQHTFDVDEYQNLFQNRGDIFWVDDEIDFAFYQWRQARSISSMRSLNEIEFFVKNKIE